MRTNPKSSREATGAPATAGSGARNAGGTRSAPSQANPSSPGTPNRIAKLDRHDLDKISSATLEHYDLRAEDFREGTRDHDVSQNIAALLRHVGGEPPFAILDFGCGPGRDLKAFAALGHLAIGLEGAARFVAMARADAGCEVWQQDFLKLDLPDARFDGVFANASLFHVPSQELPRVLRQLRATLKAGGVLFSSNPRGANEEGWNRGRYGAYHDLPAWRRWMSDAGFVELDHYYRPAGLPREEQPWLATVWRKPVS
jgi:SAM-dependent methyltransferase